eukprot:TRINITY_DN1321_c0_g1_i2.p1 TRINITY_DN1321_c0_g1~~TRINITY_DN1321_c0_g1_i2.p1  ORF type:complete len:375 (-),score=83.85 TRINITY_DN1321_c0_g1_i2:276-1349(-)
MSAFEQLLQTLSEDSGDQNPIFHHLDIKSLCSLSQCSRTLRLLASAEHLWKGFCLARWSELQSVTLSGDPFPAWKSCFGRKSKEGETKLEDLMREFKDCDWYSCPNGHLYLIGECRLPMRMAKCATCGLPIGGRDHRMISHNKRLGSVWKPDLKEVHVEKIESTFRRMQGDLTTTADHVDVFEENHTQPITTTSSTTSASPAHHTPIRKGPLKFDDSNRKTSPRLAEDKRSKYSPSAFETPPRSAPHSSDLIKKSPPDLSGEEDPSEGSSDEHTSSTTVSVEGEDDPFRLESRLREEFQLKKESALREMFRTMGSSPARGVYESYSNTTTENAEENYSDLDGESLAEFPSDDELIGL